MEVAEQYSKRPRLNSWESTSISSFPGQQQQQQQSYYSPHSQYSGSTISMEGWGETKPRSLSTSAGGSNKPPSQHFSAYLNSPPSSHMSSTGHRLSMNAGTISPSLSSEAHAYSNSFQEQSEMDPSTANSTPPSGSIQARLKPLHTASAFQDQVTYFHAHYEQQPSAAGPNSHRGSINDPTSAAEMSPTSSNVGIALGAYPGSGFSHQLVAASPQGIVLGAPQAVNVVTTYPPRRKAIRAAQACDACRARKAKCDEGRPSCGFCKESQVACIYREVPPPKQDRTLLQILERLGRVETLLGTMNSREEADRKDGLNSMAATAAAVVHISPQLPPPPPNCPAPPAARRNSAGNEMDGGPKLNIPHQHTMAAHKILWWPSIQELIDPELLKQENYVIDEEQNRGTLRIHGRGEEYSGGDPNFEEDSSYSGTGMEDWNGLTYNIGSEWEEGTQTENGGGPRGDEAANGDQVVPDIHQDDFISGLMADCDGKLRLDSQFVQELLNSYLANIHILHPILDKASITHTVSRFVDFFGSPSQQQQGYNDLGLSNETEALMSSPRSNSNNSIPGSGKRKRSISIPQPQQQNKPRSIPRTVHSALVLLVLALGAVCLHRRPVPGPLPRSPTYPSGFSTSTPPFGTSATPPYSVNTPPYQQTRRELKNIDVIPGLAYFSQAMEIMGALAGSNDLESIQSGLLAGLYWGQLGRVLDSWKWISWSCTGCQILIRMKLPIEKDPLRKDLILRTFWSSLQLETDILAELDLPPSNLSHLEDTTPLPTAISSPKSPYADDPSMWLYYLAQISLRKLLSRVHSDLNKQESQAPDSPRCLAVARELDYQLESWKAALPAPLHWDPADPPPSDINAARLRAQYYSARYTIHRPFVYHALHGNSIGAGNWRHHRGGNNNSNNNNSTATSPEGEDNKPDESRDDISPSELEINSRKCIEAALQSTAAFHAFDPDHMRPIITNVFGTAHAQFGNLLVLQAAHQSPALRGMASDYVLGELVAKTIHWFQTLAAISPALRRDAEILQNAAEKLDFQLQMYR